MIMAVQRQPTTLAVGRLAAVVATMDGRPVVLPVDGRPLVNPVVVVGLLRVVLPVGKIVKPITQRKTKRTLDTSIKTLTLIKVTSDAEISLHRRIDGWCKPRISKDWTF